MAMCQEAGCTSWRDRVLTPVTTIQLFLLQRLHGHTACSHVPHLSGGYDLLIYGMRASEKNA